MSHRLLALAVVAACSVAVPAKAETPDETAFGFGQFIGAASFCKVPKEKVSKVAAGLLSSAGIDSSGPSPLMKRFTEGVTDGVKSMRAPDAAPCSDVTTAFDAAFEKFGD